jgi:AsmA-like C-terminal region
VNFPGIRSIFRHCVGGLCALAIWSLWLALAAALAVQIYVVSAKELAVPRFVQRGISERLAASGISATFGRTRFDPSGRMLIENVAITLPTFAEPVITARALYVRFDPWALAVGRVEPLELRATGVSAVVPAMFSPSGRAEALVRELDIAVRRRGEEVTVDYASARVGNVAVSMRGSFRPGAIQSAKTERLPLAQFLARNYGAYSRRFAAALLILQALDQPSLHLDLFPSEAGGATVRATLLARELKLNNPFEAQTGMLALAARFPLAGVSKPAEAEAVVDELRLPGSVTARGVHIWIDGTLDPDQARVEWSRARVAAEALSAEGFTFEYPLASATPGPLPRLQAEARARILGVPLAARGTIDVKAGSAEAQFNGALSPGLLDPVGARLGRDLRPFVDFPAPARIEGEVHFAPGWRFQRAAAYVSAEHVMAYHVALDEARGRVEFDGRRLRAYDAFARIGADFANGSYENDLPTHRYRYLLDGRLRPLDITAWFPKAPWWPQLFDRFAFPDAPPYASVDVRGLTDNGRAAETFAFVDSKNPVLEGARVDRVLTRLFARYQFADAMEVLVTDGSGAARGTFTRRGDTDTGDLQSLDVDLSSTLDLGPAGKIPEIAATFAPFVFDRPPALAVLGHFDGPKSPRGAHTDLQVELRSDTGLRFYNFPLDSAVVHASVRDDEMVLDRMELGFAGGAATGEAHLSGRGAERKLGFQASLKDASLGGAIAAVQEFSRDPKSGGPPPAPSKYVAEKANVRFDMSVHASGACADPKSFSGDGSAVVRGADLFQVKLLGALSKLLTFTSLRFTGANAKFRIADGRLIFPEIDVTGANSAIQASGNYRLINHGLDFNAKIYPFQKSSSIPQILLNMALTPLTSVMETKLTGTIENPKWALSLGLPNLPRSDNRQPSGTAPQPPSPLKASGQNSASP